MKRSCKAGGMAVTTARRTQQYKWHRTGATSILAMSIILLCFIQLKLLSDVSSQDDIGGGNGTALTKQTSSMSALSSKNYQMGVQHPAHHHTATVPRREMVTDSLPTSTAGVFAVRHTHYDGDQYYGSRSRAGVAGTDHTDDETGKNKPGQTLESLQTLTQNDTSSDSGDNDEELTSDSQLGEQLLATQHSLPTHAEDSIPNITGNDDDNNDDANKTNLQDALQITATNVPNNETAQPIHRAQQPPNFSPLPPLPIPVSPLSAQLLVLSPLPAPPPPKTSLTTVGVGKEIQRLSKTKAAAADYRILEVPQQQRQIRHVPDPHYSIKSHKSPVLDVLATGSKSRTNYIDGQRSTWASHVFIRNFYSSYSLEDEALLNGTVTSVTKETEFAMHLDETACLAVSTNVYIQAHGVSCRTHRRDDSSVMRFWRNEKPFGPELTKKPRTSAPGWFCAQRRPGISLGRLGVLYRNRLENDRVLRQEQKESETPFVEIEGNSNNATEGKNETNVLTKVTRHKVLPDFLLLTDDDTYVNMELMGDYLSRAAERIKGNAPMVYAGCTFPRAHSFAYGGYGLIFNTAALERMVRPINCTEINAASPVRMTSSVEERLKLWASVNEEDFPRQVCLRIEQNLIGEGKLFIDGMSLSDLMSAISSSESFCMHSDWVTGHFIKFYYLSSRPVAYLKMTIRDTDPVNRLHAYQNNRFPNCVKRFDGMACDSRTAHVCHQQTPEMMANLTRAWRDRIPSQFRDL